MRIQSCTVCETGKSVRLKTDQGNLILFGVAENIVRCVYTKREEVLPVSPVGVSTGGGVLLDVSESGDLYEIGTDRLCVQVEKKSGYFTWKNRENGETLLQERGRELSKTPLLVYTTGEEEPVIRRVVTVDGERNFVENLKPSTDHMVYRAKLYFRWEPEEGVYGLGQGEEGIFNYRDSVQYLYQHNMRIPIPFLLSDRHYGILADCGSLMTFQDDCRGSWLYLDAVEQLDYYLIAGSSADEIIAGYRMLTGKAVMLPKWAFGYVQSKEAYHTQADFCIVDNGCVSWLTNNSCWYTMCCTNV